LANRIFDDLNLFALLGEAETETETGVSTESNLLINLSIEKGVRVFYCIMTLASEL